MLIMKLTTLKKVRDCYSFFRGRGQNHLHGKGDIWKCVELEAKTLLEDHAFQSPQIHNANKLDGNGRLVALKVKLPFDKIL